MQTKKKPCTFVFGEKKTDVKNEHILSNEQLKKAKATFQRLGEKNAK